MDTIQSVFESFGLGENTVYVLFVVGVLLFVFSTREIVAWFLKLNKIIDEIEAQKELLRELDAKMNSIIREAKIARYRPPQPTEERVKPETPATASENKPSSQFPLNH